MAYQYVIDREKKIVLSTAEGEFNDVDWMSHREEMQNDNQFDPSFGHFVDLSRITKIKVSSSLAKASNQDRGVKPAAKTAVYVHDPVAWGLLRMYSGYSSDDKNIRRFKTTELALTWLAHTDCEALSA